MKYLEIYLKSVINYTRGGTPSRQWQKSSRAITHPHSEREKRSLFHPLYSLSRRRKRRLERHKGRRRCTSYRRGIISAVRRVYIAASIRLLWAVLTTSFARRRQFRTADAEAAFTLLNGPMKNRRGLYYNFAKRIYACVVCYISGTIFFV